MFERAKRNWYLRGFASADWKKREAAAKSLAEIDDKKAIEALLGALKDPAYEVRRAAAKGLGQLKAREAIEPLIELLGDESSSVRQYAASGLSSLGDRSWRQVVRGEKEDIEHLASCGDPRAVAALVYALRQVHGFNERTLLRHRTAAAEALVGLASRSPSFLKEHWKDIQSLAGQHHSDTAGGGRHGDAGVGIEFPDEPKGSSS